MESVELKRRSGLYALGWVVLSTLAVLLVPLILRDGLAWQQALAQAPIQSIGIVVASLVTLGYASISLYRDGRVKLRSLSLVTAVVLMAFYAVLLVDVRYSRIILVQQSMMLGGFLGLAFVLQGRMLRGMVGWAVTAFPLVLVVLTWSSFVRTDASNVSEVAAVVGSDRVVSVARNVLRIQTYPDVASGEPATGGDLALLGDEAILVTGGGSFYRVTLRPGSGITVQSLGVNVPVNWAEFSEDVDDDVEVARFRVAGLALIEDGSNLEVFTLHHHWNRAEACVTVRLSSLQTSKEGFLAGEQKNDWVNRFETQPCLPIRDAGISENGQPATRFGGGGMGGRMWVMPDKSILFTLGDHARDGVRSGDIVAAQDMDSPFGKVHRFDPRTNVITRVTSGHRNPQGLMVDSSGRIWSTEHGPEGGDELNLLTDGGNYGWPYATYGTHYFSNTWPLATPDDNPEYTLPVYSWIPSIGISNLIQHSGNGFSDWAGDFLIGSMRDRNIWRVRVREERVVFTEQIPVGVRVRDLVELDDGRVMIWEDEGGLLLISSDEGHTDAAATYARCAVCHGADGAGAPGLGPDIRGILGRPVAGLPGYEYSPELAGFGGTWTEARLDKFLRDPGETVPGTRMVYDGVKNPEKRRRLIEYLRELRAGGDSP